MTRTRLPWVRSENHLTLILGFHGNADRPSHCPAGAASIGKGIGGILFSRFSRSSGQVGGVEEEPSDSEGGASEVENVASGEEGVTVTESEEKEKQIEEERKEVEPAMSQSTSAVLDSTSCKYCGSAEQLCIRGSTPVKPTKSCFLLSILITFYFLLFSVFLKISLVQFQYRPSQHQTVTDFNQCDSTISV